MFQHLRSLQKFLGRLQKEQPSYLHALTKAHAAVARMDALISLSPLKEEILHVCDAMESCETLHFQKLNITLEDFFHRQCTLNKNKALFLQHAQMESMMRLLQWNRIHMQSKPINLQYIERLHKKLHGDAKDPADEIGHLRTRQNWIGDEGCSIEKAYLLPPKPQDVPHLMHALCTFMKTKKSDPLVHTALCFAQFLIIHPFMDGNGRLGRLLAANWIYKKGLTATPCAYLSRYCRQNRAYYLWRLFGITEKNGWEEWILFFLKGIDEECSRAAALAERAHSLNHAIHNYLLRYPEKERLQLVKMLLRNPIIPKNNSRISTGLPHNKTNEMVEELLQKKWIRPYDRSTLYLPLWSEAIF